MRFIIVFFVIFSASVQAQDIQQLLKNNPGQTSFAGSAQAIEVHDVLNNTFTQASLLIAEGNVRFNNYTFTEAPVIRRNEASIARIYSQTRPGTTRDLDRITLRLQVDSNNNILSVDFRIISGYRHTGEYQGETIEWVQWAPNLRGLLKGLN